jgi:hypothetical protein
MNRFALRRVLINEGLLRTAFDNKRWMDKAQKTGDPVFVEYIQYVIDQGHITPSASSVLEEFISAKRLKDQDYRRLAEYMGFSGHG